MFLVAVSWGVTVAGGGEEPLLPGEVELLIILHLILLRYKSKPNLSIPSSSLSLLDFCTASVSSPCLRAPSYKQYCCDNADLPRCENDLSSRAGTRPSNR